MKSKSVMLFAIIPSWFGNAAIALLDCLPNTEEFPTNTRCVLFITLHE